jgi:hypothetical protein
MQGDFLDLHHRRAGSGTVLEKECLVALCRSQGMDMKLDAKPIYLDYAATTPCDPRVVQAMVPYLYERFGNPASRSCRFCRNPDARVMASSLLAPDASSGVGAQP